MTKLVAELLRRVRTPPTILISLPWHDWIRGLAAHHARVPAAPPAPEMLLARLVAGRAAGFARTLRQRVEVEVRIALPVRPPREAPAARDLQPGRRSPVLVYAP